MVYVKKAKKFIKRLVLERQSGTLRDILLMKEGDTLFIYYLDGNKKKSKLLRCMADYVEPNTLIKA